MFDPVLWVRNNLRGCKEAEQKVFLALNKSRLLPDGSKETIGQNQMIRFKAIMMDIFGSEIAYWIKTSDNKKNRKNFAGFL